MFHLYREVPQPIASGIPKGIILLGASTPYEVNEESNRTYEKMISQNNAFECIRSAPSHKGLQDDETVVFSVYGLFKSRTSEEFW